MGYVPDYLESKTGRLQTFTDDEFAAHVVQVVPDVASATFAIVDGSWDDIDMYICQDVSYDKLQPITITQCPERRPRKRKHTQLISVLDVSDDDNAESGTD